MTVAAALGLAVTLAAQTPAPVTPAPSWPPPAQPVAPAPVGPPGTDPAGNVWLVIYSVLPERAADFEAVARAVRDGLTKSADPVRQTQARELRVHRSSLPNNEGRILYFLQVPAITGDADRSGFDALIDAVLPSQAAALKPRLQAALDQRNPSGNTYLISVK